MRRHTDRSYLLRVWRDHAEAPLRATLFPIERPDVHHHFADLDGLLTYLDDHASPPHNREEVPLPPESP